MQISDEVDNVCGVSARHDNQYWSDVSYRTGGCVYVYVYILSIYCIYMCVCVAVSMPT